MGKRFFMNHLVQQQNKKGMTLVEVLVALAVLGIVIGPVLSYFFMAARSNVQSMDQFNASLLAQRAMEEIKAWQPQTLADEAIHFSGNSDLDPYTGVSAGSGVTVKYRVEQQQEGAPTPDPNYNFNDSGDYNLDYLIGHDQVNFESAQYDLANKKYLLEIEGTAGAYTYRFYDEGAPQPQPVGMLVTGGTINVRLKFDSENRRIVQGQPDPGIFELHVKVDDTTDKDVVFYVVDDSINQSGLKIVSEGGKSFDVYNGISSQPVEHSNILYKVTVLVEKDGETLSNVVSYVKK